MKRWLLMLAVTIVLVASIHPGQALACAACETSDLLSTSIGYSGLFRLVEAVTVANLVDLLIDDGPFTLLAPSDEAFANLPDGLWEELLADPEQLEQLLKTHILPAKYWAADFLEFDGKKMTTLSGTEVTVLLGANGVTIDGASMSSTNIFASNGLIHVLNAVLLPDK